MLSLAGLNDTITSPGQPLKDQIENILTEKDLVRSSSTLELRAKK